MCGCVCVCVESEVQKGKKWKKKKTRTENLLHIIFLLLRTGNKKEKKKKQGKYQIKHKASVCSQHWWQENVREEDWEKHWKKQMASSDWLTKHFKWRISQFISQPYRVWWALNEADKVFLSHCTERTRASRWHCKPVKHGRVSLTWSNQLWWTTKNNRNNCRICAGHKQPGGTGHSMTTCTWPKLSNDDDGSYIAIFSALEQTHCTFVACDSEWVTAAFYSVFWMSTEAVCLLHCLVVT